MADHLRLNDPISLNSKRRPPNPQGGEDDFDPVQHATTLRGILEGLESRGRSVFPVGPPQSDGDDEPEELGLGRIVLKVSGSSPFQSAQLGMWRKLKFHPLAMGNDKSVFILSDEEARGLFTELTDRYKANAANLDNLSDPKTWRQVLANIEGIDLYDRADRIAPDLVEPDHDEVTDVDIVLWPTSLAPDRDARTAAAERVDEIATLVGQSDNERVRVLVASSHDPDRLIVHARVDKPTLEKVLDNPLVQMVRGPLTADVTHQALADGRPPDSPFETAGAPIGIIDDLVYDNNPWIAGIVKARRDFPEGIAFNEATPHGTQVASIAAWGRVADLLDGAVLRQPTPIFSARVAHRGADGQATIPGEVVKAVEAAMRWLHEVRVRIVVFPFSRDYPEDEPMPEELTASIDDLARELDLVVVVAAGNLTELPDGKHWRDDYPGYLSHEKAKIAAPGTAALGLTIGSVAHADLVDAGQFPYAEAIAPRDRPSPFSRTGPTRGRNRHGRSKPELSGHGGNWAWDTADEVLRTRVDGIGAVTLRPVAAGQQLFGTVSGTSYAAPAVAHEIAKIATRYPDADANMLRALTVLAAPDSPNTDPVRHSTYGRVTVDSVLESGATRAIMTLSGQINGNSYQLIELPIPDDFVAAPGPRQIKVALAYDPPVRRSRRDYIGGRLSADFVRNKTEAELRTIYRQQPTLAQRIVERLPDVPLPGGHDRPLMTPPIHTLQSDTVVCRTFSSPAWAVDDENYWLVLTHDYSPWTETQKGQNPVQSYAVAVEITAPAALEVDLHASAQSRLEEQARLRERARQRSRTS